MSAALVSALAVVSAAAISAMFAWLSHRGNARVEQVAAVLDAYNEIVKNLQSELKRVQTELDNVREAMIDCERRGAELREELELMKAEMAGIRTTPKVATRKRAPKAP
jgi:phage shock protein A